MLATLDDNGIYHDAHVITSITQNNAPPTPIKITSYPVFSSDPTLNAEEATQVQWAMSEDTAPYGTAPTAGLSNGQEIVAKTGTTNTAQSAFFIGAIPSQALAVALFTNEQGKGNEDARQPRRHFPGRRRRRHLAGRDLAHLRPGRVRAAGSRAVHHARLHRQHMEPGAAGPAQGREEAQAQPRPERLPERPERFQTRTARTARTATRTARTATRTARTATRTARTAPERQLERPAGPGIGEPRSLPHLQL